MSSVVLVLVAHDGRALHLDVEANTTVEAVQLALVSFTGIPLNDQIVMCRGARMCPRNIMSTYMLPLHDLKKAGSLEKLEDVPIFLYNKVHLRHGDPKIEFKESREPVYLPSIPSDTHVDVHRDLIKHMCPVAIALSDHERTFEYHVRLGRAYFDVGQRRLRRCCQLLSEQEVQARALDAAREHVERHYSLTFTAHRRFLGLFDVERSRNADALVKSRTCMNAMRVNIPNDHWINIQIYLSDMYSITSFEDTHATCLEGQSKFADKVAEHEVHFVGLREEIQSLLSQASSTDLDEFGRTLGGVEALLDENLTIVQVFIADLKKVKTLLVHVIEGLSTSGDATLVTDAIRVMNDSHLNDLLPKVVESDRESAAFHVLCGDCKARMVEDVLGQLRWISKQQSNIRDTKNELAVLGEELQAQSKSFDSLRHVCMVYAAYRSSVDECVRREAWTVKLTSQAARIAEHLASVSDREGDKRKEFRAQVEHHIPLELLSSMGLLNEPGRCYVVAPPVATPSAQICK
jgi:hypothetical protein